MARDFKKEYERRLKNAAKLGKSRQEARGHRPQEHIARKEREIEERGISGAQEKTITDWYARTYNPGGKMGRVDEDEVLDMARSEGYEAFKEWRDTWEAARRNYQKPGYKHKGPEHLLELAISSGREDISWLYYH